MEEKNVKEFKIDENSMAEKEDVVEEEKVITVDLVPGTLHFNIMGLIGDLQHKMSQVACFYVALEDKEKGILNIREITKKDADSCNEYFSIQVTDLLQIEMYLYAKFEDVLYTMSQGHTRKMLEKKLCPVGSAQMIFELDDLRKYHNKPTIVDQKIQQKTKLNPFKRLIQMLGPDIPNIYGIKTEICYTSNEEEEMIVEQKNINSSKDLHKWLHVRENTFKKFFHGYVNIKGYNMKVCTHLWKRRFVQWNGYEFILFNVYTQEEVGSLNFSKHLPTITVEAVDISQKNFLKDNLIKINIESGFLELHFDNLNAFETCLSASEHLFGKVHKIKNW